MRQNFFFTCVFFLTLFIHVLEGYTQTTKKVLKACYADKAMAIDGKLTEDSWVKAEKASDFIQYSPEPGKASSQKTEVSILYDNSAIYVGAWLWDNDGDSILKQLAARDDYGNNNDYFGVTFDTYEDNQNGSIFIVTSAGVQADGIMKFDGVDWSWNAAWYSKVTLGKKGWFVEMKIPYSALRFPKKPVQEWGINFNRLIRRNRENSYWNTVSPTMSNVLSQSGILKEIHDIESPVRLSLLPYVSAYAENYSGANAHSFNGGMDIKYGLNESFTLDMTLVPDFGQTPYDAKVLNLSPIEVKYNEQRYFFTEGLSLFNKDDLFYTRRVGGTPVLYSTLTNFMNTNEIIIQNPSTTNLYNATKISGRTKKKLGIGLFNASSAPTYATVKDTTTGLSRQILTAPLTNYNVLVLDQALKNNSYISFVNTNVTRATGSYNADVSALLFKFANKSNSYGIDGSYDVSQIYKTSFPDIGSRLYFDLAKMSGNYTFALNARVISDKFNPNDLGYLDRNNICYYSFGQSYNIYKPFGQFVNAYNYLGITYDRIYQPDAFSVFNIYGSHSATTKSYISFGCYYTLQPFQSNDYLEPRTAGRYYIYPQLYNAGCFVSSDYRKKFALDINVSKTWLLGNYRNSTYFGISPRYRFSDRFSLIYGLSLQKSINDVGYVDNVNDSIFFGIRDISTITNSLNAAYIFTNTMSLKLNMRHYWSQASYNQYNFLNNDGKLYNTYYNTNHDINYNTFNVYLSFVWQYLPGSEASVVYQNSIYSSASQLTNGYFADAGNTFQMPQSNSLSLKIIYYLDYLYIRDFVQKKKGTTGV